MALRTVGVKLMAEVSSYVGGMRTAQRSTRDFVADLDKAAKAGKLDAVADQAGRMGLGLVAAFGIAAGAAARFDKQMSEVGAVSNATGADLERLRHAALKAGEDTAFSATEAAKAEAELAKAGLSTSEILGGALSGSLSLAAAGSLDLAESADIAAKTMNVFKLEGNDVGHVADVLAAAANKSATDVHEMGEALRMGGLAANSAGMSMEETVGTLAAFADRALVGSDAGTSLKTMLTMLAAPSDKAANLMEQLGINTYDVQGNFIGVEKLAGVLQQRLGGLTQEQRNAALATIFGADAMRAANVLYEVGAEGVAEYVAAVDDQGAAAEMAAKKTDNLIGDVERLTGSLETLAIEGGSGANSGLRVLTQSANALVDEFGQLPPVIGSTITVLAGIAGVSLLAFAGWVKMRRGIADALDELRQVGPTGSRAARGLEVTSKWAGRATMAFIALEIAGAALSKIVGNELNPQIDALSKGLASWGKDGRLAGEAARVLGADMEDLGTGLKFLADTDNSRRKFARWGQDLLEEVVPGLDSTNTSLTKTRERVSAMDAALAQLASSGQADEAAAAFDRLAAAAAKEGVSVEELKALFPEYAAALETGASASDKAAGAITDVGSAAGLTAEQVQELKDAFDRLFGIQMDLDRAVLKYHQGILDLNEELRSGTRDTRLNTEEGQKNRAAVLDQVDAIGSLRQARIDHGMSIEDANAKYQEDIRGLQASMRAANFTEEQIKELTGAYYEIPDQAATSVSAPGATTATKQVETFNNTIRNVPPSKRVPFFTTAPEAKAAVEALRLKIAQIKNKSVRIQVYWTSSGNLHVPGGTLIKDRWGGVHEGGYTKAATGVVRDAAMFGARSPGHYLVAEPQTGGELFAPKNWDMDRTRAMVDYAVENWWGGNVNWQGSPSASNWAGVPAPSAGGGGVVNVRLVNAGVIGSRAELENWLTRAVDNLRRKGRA